MRHATPEQRFWRFVNKTETCWNWTGSRLPTGYARFWGGKERGPCYGHRFSYEMHVGPIPDGMQLDHLGRVRACCNPEHLEPVTCRENLIRGDTRTAREAAQICCVHGHPFSEANTRITALGKRACRACDRDRARAYRLRAA